MGKNSLNHPIMDNLHLFSINIIYNPSIGVKTILQE